MAQSLTDAPSAAMNRRGVTMAGADLVADAVARRAVRVALVADADLAESVEVSGVRTTVAAMAAGADLAGNAGAVTAMTAGLRAVRAVMGGAALTAVRAHRAAGATSHANRSGKRERFERERLRLWCGRFCFFVFGEDAVRRGHEGALCQGERQHRFVSGMLEMVRIVLESVLTR